MSKICAICGRQITETQYATIRQKWLDGNRGWGDATKEIVHITCDKRERKAKARKSDNP